MATAHQASVSDLDRTNRDGLRALIDRLVRQLYGEGASGMVRAVLTPHLGTKKDPRGWIVYEHEATLVERLPIEDVPIDVLVAPLRDAAASCHDEVERLLCGLVTKRIVAESPRELQDAGNTLGPAAYRVWLLSEWLRETLLSEVQPQLVETPDRVLGTLFGADYGLAHTPTRGSAYAFTKGAGFLCLPEPLKVLIDSDGNHLTVSAIRSMVICFDPMAAVRVAYAPGS